MSKYKLTCAPWLSTTLTCQQHDYALHCTTGKEFHTTVLLSTNNDPYPSPITTPLARNSSHNRSTTFSGKLSSELEKALISLFAESHLRKFSACNFGRAQEGPGDEARAVGSAYRKSYAVQAKCSPPSQFSPTHRVLQTSGTLLF